MHTYPEDLLAEAEAALAAEPARFVFKRERFKELDALYSRSSTAEEGWPREARTLSGRISDCSEPYEKEAFDRLTARIHGDDAEVLRAVAFAYRNHLGPLDKYLEGLYGITRLGERLLQERAPQILGDHYGCDAEDAYWLWLFEWAEKERGGSALALLIQEWGENPERMPQGERAEFWLAVFMSAYGRVAGL